MSVVALKCNYILKIKRAMDIYENIVIGNFLYGLGANMGYQSKTKDLPFSVNLLQQTPLDKNIGDVLLQGARVMRILEFKRAQNDDIKEASKLLHLQRTLSAPDNLDLIDVSREVHWFIKSRGADNRLDIQIVPYLDFMRPRHVEKNLQLFIEKIVEAAQSTYDNSECYSRYLKVVADSQGSITGSSGGLIVCLDNNGKVNYMAVDDLRDLRLTLSELHDVYIQRHIQPSPEKTQQRTHDYSPGR